MTAKKPAPEKPADSPSSDDFTNEVLPDNTKAPVGRPAEKGK